MKANPNRSGLSRYQRIALLFGVLVLGFILVAFNLGLYEKWVVKPREDSEAQKTAGRFDETQKINGFESRLREELEDEDEDAVVARLGPPDEKRNVEYVSDGKIRPLWRYKYPPVIVSFCDGQVESVRVESLSDFPRELLDAQNTTKEQTLTARNLYPLNAGNKWEYELFERSKPEVKIQVVTEAVAIETNDGRITAKLVANVPGENAKEEKVMSDDRGVYRNGVSGLNSDREFPIIKYPVKPGDTWNEKLRINDIDAEMTFKVSSAVEVKVPAGKFTAIPITSTIRMTGGNAKSKKWFVEGVGIVKETMTLDERVLTRQLKKFTPGK